MGTKDVLADYDAAIDEMIEDARGFHETVDKMRQDKNLDLAGVSPQQVSQIARRDDRYEDEAEDLGFSEADLDAFDAEMSGGGGNRKLVVIVPASRGGLHLEAISNGRVVAHKPVPPGSAQKVLLHVPNAPCAVRLLAPVHAVKVAKRGNVQVDLRQRRRRGGLNP